MKRIGIEALLSWAYRQELPKAGSGGEAGQALGGGWDAISDFGEIWTLIDSSNAWGCVPDYSAEAEPHPDAVIVGRTVKALGDAWFEMPEAADGFDMLADVRLSGGERLTDGERADCHARGFALARVGMAGRVPGLIIRHAMLQTRPGWSAAGTVERRAVLNPQGGPAWFRTVMRSAGAGRPDLPVELDGFNRASRRPHPGAYQKTRLVPDPAGLVAERLDYQAWALGLATLAGDLAGRLAGHAVDGPYVRLWPWEGEGAHAAAVVSISEKSGEASGRAEKAA
ncbi:hypothetical protein [Aurantimonas sp. VKM B-3413]|uniref:hypothetical protein n=1 Tax=Aurantimonas sp. VKM B-3413 TaxID=2779401 RepID=UPI001E35BA70|nr:hypothetical protein [Aurantimonas sp. VKM B-3413]MCB8835952.1 hypothetical protein [Aurantimonas sp. VKM B-3413]